MQSEDFDKKIRDAADHHHPAYNEKAWGKMAHLLDEHLPVKKDRRRRFLFLWLFLVLLGGTAWLILEQPWQKNTTASLLQSKTPATEKENKPASQSGTASTYSQDPVKDINAEKETNSSPAIPSPDRSLSYPEQIDQQSPEKKLRVAEPLESEKSSRFPGDRLANAPQKKWTINKTPGNRELDERNGNTKQDKTVIGKGNVQQSTVPAEGKAVDEKLNSKPVAISPSSDLKNDQPVNAKTDATGQEKKENLEQSIQAKQDSAVNAIVPPVQKKKKAIGRSRNNGFSLSISSGPDFSMVGLDRAGKLQPVFGAGISYSFGKRFTLRTGFYTANKIYTAGKEDYKPDVLSPNYNYLEKIDADCKVYEIPLTLAWQFGENKQRNWFAAAGLSSYLMKKERYEYYYKYPSGQTYYYTRNLEDENKHFFSVLALSGGYTRKLSPIFSLTAEPYIRLPLAGVGYGHMKLYSGGVLFTLSARLTGSK